MPALAQLPYAHRPGTTVSLLRIVRLLSLVLWVGSIAFFAFGVAPVAFHVLPSSHLAGTVVAGSLRVLHALGLASGAIFLLSHLSLWRMHALPARPAPLASVGLMLAMLAGTAISQWAILPAMERDRQQAGGAIEQADIDDPARVDFDRLHRISEKLEGAVLLCGLVVVAFVAVEREPVRPAGS